DAGALGLGIVRQHADAGELKNLGRTYCDRGLAMCHAVGHIVRIASESLTEALELCDSVSDGVTATRCYQGVFMEDIGQLSFVVKPVEVTFTEYGYPCNILAAKYSEACYVQLTEYQEKLFEQRAIPLREQHEIASAECTTLKQPARSYCFFGVGF
ncbi:MAG: hypothetical protein AAB288_01190, partial [Acidobacteriota bacterium]